MEAPPPSRHAFSRISRILRRQAPSVSMEPPSNQDSERLIKLRELRAEIQDLQDVFQNIKRGETTAKEYSDYIKKTREDIAELDVQIKNGDSIRHLHNLLEQVYVNPLISKPETRLDAQKQLHQLNLLDALFKKVVYQIGLLAIPPRIEDWLVNARPGYYIPFHAVFEDELPDLQDRMRLLEFLAWQPEVIPQGLIEATTGLIYRYSRRRWPSHLLLALAFILAIGIVLGAPLLPLEGWSYSQTNIPTFLIGWGALLLGVIVHVGIGTVKRAQSQVDRPPIISIGDLPLYLSAKAGQLLLKLLLALIGFFGFVLSVDISNVTPLNLFLVGYSLDSVVEVFGSSFEKQATSQVSVLKQQLGVTPGD